MDVLRLSHKNPIRTMKEQTGPLNAPENAIGLTHHHSSLPDVQAIKYSCDYHQSPTGLINCTQRDTHTKCKPFQDQTDKKYVLKSLPSDKKLVNLPGPTARSRTFQRYNFFSDKMASVVKQGLWNGLNKEERA